jgi:mutator protein MutT
MDRVEVAAAAIIQHGRVLAARRTHPADVAGGWELPGGKVDPGETVEHAVVREIREELGCGIRLVESLPGRSPIKPGYELTAHVVELIEGEPLPTEHDAVRWLSVEDLDDVDWLPSDRPFLPLLRDRLDRGDQLEGGNVGGAARIGRTVRRATGSWTPAVHALLAHLRAEGLDGVPQVLGIDDLGREALTYLPGRLIDVDDPADEASDLLLADAAQWLHRFHRAGAGFHHPGPWRTGPAPTDDEIVCHHDFAPYNWAWSTSADGPRLVGVFDWDMAGAGKPIDDLSFLAWNGVPLFRAGRSAEADARRLTALAAGYDGEFSPIDVLDHVVERIGRSVRVIRAGQQAGDPGMLSLATHGEPERTEGRLADLVRRAPAVRALLGT